MQSNWKSCTIQLYNNTRDGSDAHFTYGTWLIFKIYEQVITLQVKVHNIFRVQIFQAKCSIHCYDKPLTTIEISVQEESILLLTVNNKWNQSNHRKQLLVLALQNMSKRTINHELSHGCQCTTWPIFHNAIKCHNIWMMKLWKNFSFSPEFVRLNNQARK